MLEMTSDRIECDVGLDNWQQSVNKLIWLW